MSKKYKDARRWTAILETGGRGIHSDDEHFLSNDVVLAKAAIMPWRSQEFTDILRLCDHLHISAKVKPDGTLKNGVMPRARITGRYRSDRPAVRDLPRNCYDAAWLRTLDEDEIQALRIRDSVVLSIRAGLVQCVFPPYHNCLRSSSTIGAILGLTTA